MERPLVFQRRFIQRAMAPQIRTAALSIPRGNGKSWLAARILTHELRKRIKNVEYDLCATSIEQARAVFGFVQGWLGETDLWGRWTFTDSTTRLGARFDHKRGGRLVGTTKFKILSSNAKTAMGIVRCPLIVADEPASWEVIGGRKMHDAIQTAQGKPGSPLRVIYIGTQELTAGWWAELLEHGSHGSTYVQTLKANKKKWDHVKEVRRVNPLKWWDPVSRASAVRGPGTLPKKSERLKARFMTLRVESPHARLDRCVAHSRGLGKGRQARDVHPRVASTIRLSGWTWAVAGRGRRRWRSGRERSGPKRLRCAVASSRLMRWKIKTLCIAGHVPAARG